MRSVVHFVLLLPILKASKNANIRGIQPFKMSQRAEPSSRSTLTVWNDKKKSTKTKISRLNLILVSLSSLSTPPVRVTQFPTETLRVTRHRWKHLEIGSHAQVTHKEGVIWNEREAGKEFQNKRALLLLPLSPNHQFSLPHLNFDQPSSPISQSFNCENTQNPPPTPHGNNGAGILFAWSAKI